MSIEEVIQSGNFDLSEITFIDLVFSPTAVEVAIIVFIMLAVLYGIFFFISPKWPIGLPSYITIRVAMFATLIGFVLFIASLFQAQNEITLSNQKEYKQKTEKWMISQVIPFIQALPTHKVKVRPLKIVPDDSVASNLSAPETIIDSFSIPYQLNVLKSTTSTVDLSSKVTMMYENQGQIMTETQYMQIRSLPSSDRSSPYMTYQLLTNDLGHSVAKGKYNTTLYLPLDYVFE